VTLRIAKERRPQDLLAWIRSDMIKMGLGGLGLEGRRWTELAYDRVLCWGLVLAVLKLLVLLPKS
jgi:hypothetical protein